MAKAELVAQSPTHRPRIALVLSSGGARGLAHVGVLKALEELHVHVDLVVGSEWGALVGGLYAAGQTPDEIQRALISREWADALADRMPRRFLSFRSKQEDRDFLADLPLGIGAEGLILPPSILLGQRMRIELGRLTMRTLGLERFDDLPIPFRAVATDLELGETVTLENGSLAKAIEASLATPVVMPPVDDGGRVLISGALSDPLPIDVALALGAEHVIVVDVVQPVSGGARPNLLEVGTRAMDFVARRREAAARAGLRAGDVLCVPEIDASDPVDFARAPAVVELGRVALLALADRLAPLAADPAAQAATEKRVRRSALPVIDAVRVRDGSPLGQEAIESRLDNHVGSRFDPDAASTDLARFYGLKLFGRVDIELQNTSEDHADLIVGAEPTPTAPLHWRMGLAGEVNAGDGVNFVVGGSVRYAPMDDWGSEFRAKVELGTRLLTSLEYRYALDPAGLWFLVPSASWLKHPVRVDAGDGHVSQYSVNEVDLGLDLVREIGDVWEARAGIEYRGGDSTLDLGEPVPGNGGNFEAGGARFGLTCDSLDDLAFPSSGWLVRTDWFVPIEDFKSGQDEIVRARVDHPLPLWGGSLTLGGEFGDVVNGDGNVESFQPLGGFLRLSGLRSEAISGPTSVLGRAVYTHALGPTGLERKVFTWYGGASAELGSVFDDVDEITLEKMLPSGSMFVGVDTLFGPLYVGYGLTEGGHNNLFLVLGRQF